MRIVLCTLALFSASSALAQPKPVVEPAALEVAEQYLDALTGSGPEAGRGLLLGGATMNAQLFILENWRIVRTEPVRREERDLAAAKEAMAAVDEAGQQARAALMDVAEGEGMEMLEVSREEAAQLMEPTRERASAFLRGFPVLAFATRVDKEVYWHPQNPLRTLLNRTPDAGRYKLELYLFHVETTEGPRKVPRVWPLRVLRLRAGNIDTGWRVLPASDWNAE